MGQVLIATALGAAGGAAGLWAGSVVVGARATPRGYAAAAVSGAVGTLVVIGIERWLFTEAA